MPIFYFILSNIHQMPHTMASGIATTKISNSVRPIVNAAMASDIDKAAAAMPAAIKASAIVRASENAKPAASIMDAATTATPSVIATAVPARTSAMAPATGKGSWPSSGGCIPGAR